MSDFTGFQAHEFIWRVAGLKIPVEDLCGFEASIIGGEWIPLFIEQGLDIEVHNRFYETPLILAAKTKFESMYQFLLKAGADPNARDIEGNSAKEIHDRDQTRSTPVSQPSAAATAQP